MAGDRPDSRLDEEPKAGSQGEVEPGSEGDFGGAPVDEDPDMKAEGGDGPGEDEDPSPPT